MNSTSSRLPTLLVGILFSCAAIAQAPDKPPPWWGVQDEQTVSLHWDFNVAFPAGQPTLAPTFAVVPTWYNNPVAVTGWTASPNLVWQNALSGHVGVIALTGTGVPLLASLDLKVDNDPHLDWVKLFYFQFDAFEGASGQLARAIEQDLLKYDRAIVSETSVPLGNGWRQVTISAQLIPQPDDETIAWTFTENALGTVAMDNLFVSSKCVKPGPDKDGDALGDVSGFAIDLTAATLGADCQAAAVTEGPAPGFPLSYWVCARASFPGSFHQLFRLNAAGTVTASISLGATLASAPFGPSDLAVETTPIGPLPSQQFIYVLLDKRATPGGFVELHKFDTAGGLPIIVNLVGFPPIPPAPFGLAFDPSGNLGAGTFWVTDPNPPAQPTGPNAYEFRRNGTLLDSKRVPVGCVGLGYDDTLGNFYGFSRSPRASPGGIVQVNGFEWSGYDFEPTGVEFCGDIRIANPGGSLGGVASGLEVYRRSGGGTLLTSELRMACVVDITSQNRQVLYNLAGPFGFGRSLMGRCGMQGGPPFVGSSFQVTLSGVPNSIAAVLYVGFSNQVWAGGALPFSLSASLGWPESILCISPNLDSGLLTPTAPGSFAFPLALPPASGLSYVPLFFQWIVLDSSVPGFLAATQAGKTIAY